MSDELRIDIFKILDWFNEEVGYDGLNNEGKKTDERDDIITRQIFNHWLREYEKQIEKKIKSKRISQYKNEWYIKDIKKLIETDEVQYKLKKAYERKTVAINIWQDPSKSKRISKKKYDKYLVENENSINVKVQECADNIIEKIIDNIFTLKYKNKTIRPFDYLDKEKIIRNFINIEKVLDEAFNIVDGLYTTPVSGNDGTIVNIMSEEPPEIDYYLK